MHNLYKMRHIILFLQSVVINFEGKATPIREIFFNTRREISYLRPCNILYYIFPVLRLYVSPVEQNFKTCPA